MMFLKFFLSCDHVSLAGTTCILFLCEFSKVKYARPENSDTPFFFYSFVSSRERKRDFNLFVMETVNRYR